MRTARGQAGKAEFEGRDDLLLDPLRGTDDGWISPSATSPAMRDMPFWTAAGVDRDVGPDRRGRQYHP